MVPYLNFKNLVQVTFDEMDSLFHQLNQNVTGIRKFYAIFDPSSVKNLLPLSPKLQIL